MKIDPNDLTEKYLGHFVELEIPYDTIRGKLTDFYGTFDENNESIVIIEIDEEPYFVDEDMSLFV